MLVLWQNLSIQSLDDRTCYSPRYFLNFQRQVADQSELNDIWTELLNSWGNEIYMKDIRRYLKPGESASFAELSERAILCEEVAIGYRLGGNTVINPPLTSASLTCALGDSLVVISEFEYNSVGL